MSEDQIQVRFGLPDRFDLSNPFGLLPPRKLGAKLQEPAQAGRIFRRAIEQVYRIETRLAPEFSAHIVIHRRQARRVLKAFERLEVKFRQVHAVPIEPAEKVANAFGDFRKC